MTPSDALRVNYYVGAVLAQGGEVRFEEEKLVFCPTGALDRAMGAKDVEVQFIDIRWVNYNGDLSRLLRVKTDKKIHKFAGSQARQLGLNLKSVLGSRNPDIMFEVGEEAKASAPPPRSPTPTKTPENCKGCGKPVRLDFAFCPYCKTSLRPTCPSCMTATESDWIVCAFCAHQLS